MKRKNGPSPSASTHLGERIEKLSVKRQEIIRPILEHPREYVLLSVRAMAKRLRTDPATIVRIVRGLGFGSYREFQRHLHELSLAFATSLDTMQSGGRDPSVPAHVVESLEQDLKNLQGLKNSLLGLPIFAATSAGRILHLVRSVNRQDLVVAISFRRGLRQTVEGAQHARANGAYCVGIADTYLSPLARECNEVFLASVETTSFGASYVAPIALLNSLLAAVGQYHRSQTLAIVKEIAEEQRKGFRWYNP